MFIIYDPATSNQVQAIYAADTASAAWAAFTKVEVTDPTLSGLLKQYGRDCTVTIVDSAVTAVTPGDHPDDHALAKHKVERKASVDAKTEKLISAAYCDNGYTAAVTAVTSIVDTGQTLKTDIDAAADQSALDAISDTR